jgi:chemotaxis methyl-accepting protein methylase/signal transduction histidine kinase/chemotaxis response regulator CheB
VGKSRALRTPNGHGRERGGFDAAGVASPPRSKTTAGRSAKPAKPVKARSSSPPQEANFPVVGVGASAGGLQAFSQLLEFLPPDTGMAFVLIQHLDPTHKSFLCQALAKATRMPVSQVRHRERALPNHVYVIPPDADVSIRAGLLVLAPRTAHTPSPHLPIDAFFVSLATERGSRAIGVVLSGTASDGTEGLRAIKTQGGIAFAQDPKTAKFGGMPQSAVDAGVVDYSLSLSGMAKELSRLSRHPYVVTSLAHGRQRPADIEGKTDPASKATTLIKIMAVIKTVAGVDFREYKSPTFGRRLGRRMALRKVQSQQKYLELLKREPDEARALCEDALIHVTSFFRDPEVFETLKVRVLPQILKRKAEGAPIRIWVAGCSTGEEAYSLALCLLEFLGDAPHPHPVQIFGSDVSEQAIRRARTGGYSDGAMRGINEERRRRYFTKVETGYRINKNVRDLCVFVRHDLTSDPPFSKLDLLSCRNVLIYFDQSLQKRIVPMFHYSLNQPGFLLLGRTEHISGFAQLFSPEAKTQKIFARSALPSFLRFETRSETHRTPTTLVRSLPMGLPPREGDIGRHLDKLLLARYAPPGVLINDKMDILQFRGQTGAYLESAPGEPQSNLVKMARVGLLSKLRTTLQRARAQQAPVRADGVSVEHDGYTTTCSIVAVPFAGLPQIKEPLFVVLFEPEQPALARSPRLGRVPRKDADRTTGPRRLAMLEHELSATTEYLRSLVDEQSRSNEDLGSANEELVSGNEELQSLNEELETAKEELQSTNEELTTVNDELNTRNHEAAEINSDLNNLLDTVDIPIVILDKQRHIRRFTPQARAVLNLLPSDVGRLFDDIKPNIIVPDMDQLVADVISTFAAKEREVRDRDGRWYRMQIRPYKQDHGIDGAVVSLIDIDAFKHLVSKAHQAKEEAERADRAKDQFLAVLSHELRTPLSALLLQLELLRHGGTDTAKRDRACDAIERSTKIQVKLVDDLLDVSRIVTGKMRVDLQSVDLFAAVRASLDGLVALATRKSIELVVSLDQSLGPVIGDRTRLEQVVVNLVGNAIKFTPEGGKVEVLLEAADGLAHLRVRDSGMGIEAAFLPHVFERLIQSDSSSTRPYAGLGLGLAIVRHLVDAHGGTVRAESPGLGQGATFHVTLPLLRELQSPAKVTAPSAEPAIAVPVGRLADRRVLIVEDDPAICEALAEMLAHTGAAVTTADSASVGMTILRRFRPHILLCDIAMPKEDGFSFIRKVRALGAANGGDTPAVALTALAGESDRRRALADGFQMHLSKPIDMGGLVDAMVGLLKNEPVLLPSQRPSDRQLMA